MKITDIKCYPVWSGIRNVFVLKVETDEGYYGWGESGLSGRELAVKGAVEHFKRFLIGKDAMRIGALWQEMYRSQYFEGGRVLTAAISAIDIYVIMGLITITTVLLMIGNVVSDMLLALVDPRIRYS